MNQRFFGSLWEIYFLQKKICFREHQKYTHRREVYDLWNRNVEKKGENRKGQFRNSLLIIICIFFKRYFFIKHTFFVVYYTQIVMFFAKIKRRKNWRRNQQEIQKKAFVNLILSQQKNCEMREKNCKKQTLKIWNIHIKQKQKTI